MYASYIFCLPIRDVQSTKNPIPYQSTHPVGSTSHIHLIILFFHSSIHQSIHPCTYSSTHHFFLQPIDLLVHIQGNTINSPLISSNKPTNQWQPPTYPHLSLSYFFFLSISLPFSSHPLASVICYIYY